MPCYLYECSDCSILIENYCPMGKSPKTVKCTECGKKAHRAYRFSVSVPHPTSDARKGRGMG